MRFDRTGKPTFINRLKKSIMKKMLFISALAATTMLSCSKSLDDSTDGKGNPSDDPVPVRFSQSIEAVVNQVPEAGSKAIAGNKFNNEDFKVYAVEHTGTVTWAAAGSNFMDGIMLSADGSGTITYKTASDMTYYSNASDAQYQFYAIHPSTLSIAAAEAGKAPVVTVPAGTDLLVASAASAKSKNAVNLPFEHKMAQLVINIETERVPSPELKINSVTVSVQTAGTLSLGGEVQPDGAAAEKEFATSPLTINTATTTAVGDPLILPVQSISTVNIKIGDQVSATAVSISPAVTLEAGKTSTITLKIKDQDISFSHSVADWGTGNSGSGNVPM